MRHVKLAIAFLGLLLVATAASAAIIPAGIQSNVTQATLNSWGWTEIHRSGAETTVNIAPILAAATGDYLMMGIWDESAQRYAILGAGQTSVVSAITYADYFSDDGGTTLNNWSNGINWYRTASSGSWGFTSNTLTDLYSADILLQNGLNSSHGQTETVLSTGLSMHSTGTQLTNGWAFNVTGNNWTGIYNGGYERVFFTASASTVPEPASLAIWGGLGIAGLVAARRRKKLAV